VGIVLLSDGCSALSALSMLKPSSNSGTQVKAHAEIGDNKKQNQISAGSSFKTDTNSGKIVGKNSNEYHMGSAKKVDVHHNNGISTKEIILFLGVLGLVILANRVPWLFKRKKK